MIFAHSQGMRADEPVESQSMCTVQPYLRWYAKPIAHGLQSKLRKQGFIGDSIGEHIGLIKGHARSLDYDMASRGRTKAMYVYLYIVLITSLNATAVAMVLNILNCDDVTQGPTPSTYTIQRATYKTGSP